ncbi:MAG: protein disulfide oxidoreductase [Candidatus Micrarchaeia archaeon]
MALLSDKDKKYLEETFAKNLVSDVNLLFFKTSEKGKCEYCDAISDILHELATTSSKIKITEYDVEKDKKEAEYLKINKLPAIAIWGKKSYDIYYFGIPSGHEFSSLIEDIIDASRGETRLSNTTKEKLKSINKDINIKVFVTPTCPYCPIAVRLAHQFALENSKIRGCMIEAIEFQELSEKYGVMGVPKVVINDKVSFEGAVPEETFLEYVLQAANS